MSHLVQVIRRIPQGLTRECLWPWNYVEVRSNGDVAPCCVRPAIGNLRSADLRDIVDGAEVRQLRADLLTGKPDQHCQVCLLAPLTTPAALKAKITHVRSTSSA